MSEHQDTVLEILRKIDWLTEDAVDHGDLDPIDALQRINKLAMEAIHQIERMPKIDGPRND